MSEEGDGAAGTSDGDAVTVSFDSDEQLSAAAAYVNDDDGNNVSTLNLGDFTETGSGPYSYEATVTGLSDDTYEVTLTATANTGEQTTDTVTIDIS